MSTVLHEGWIEKKGQTFMAGYKKRWLVLYADRTVKYYEDTYYEILKGSIDISGATKAQNSNIHSKQWRYGWDIITPTRTWQFCSKSEIDREDWVRNINTSIKSVSAKSMPITTNRNKSLKEFAKETEVNTETTTLISEGNDYGITANIVEDIANDNADGLVEDDDDVFGNDDKDKSAQSLNVQLNAAKVNTIKNKQKPKHSPVSHLKTTINSPISHFGKDMNRLTTRTMAEMQNKCLSLAVQLGKTQPVVAEGDAYSEAFNWDQYNGKILECIQKDNTSANDLVNMDDLTCFCGGKIVKVTCECVERKVTCEFCGKHNVTKGADYFQCDNPESEYHSGNGFSVCSCCCFNQLVKKYYDPLSECKSMTIPRKIGMSLSIDRVSSIDTANQSFRAKVRIKHSWKPTKDEVLLFQDRPGDFMPLWTPRFEFPNLIETHDGGLKQSLWNTDYTILKKGESNGDNINPLPYLICGELWIDATFSEVFELENFPVDCQDLTITIKSGHLLSICEFNVPFEGQDILTIMNEFSTIPEWRIKPPKLQRMEKKIGPVVQYSQINLAVKLERIPKAYFFRMVLFLMLLTSASLVSFSIDILDNGAERISFLITLLLTAVAYQFAILNDLPKVPYLTLFDRYIMQTFFFIFAMLCETGVCMRNSEKWGEEVDEICNYVFWGIFVIVQIGFIGATIRARIYETGKLRMCPADMNKYSDKKRSALQQLHMKKFGRM